MSSTGPDTGNDEPADREIVVARVIDAPRDLVFEAFTSVEHLSRWWGPNGFTTTTRDFSFTVGGEWTFVMHGPDGTKYPEWISWTLIDPPRRIEFRHGESPDDPDAFDSVVLFTQEGGMTRVELRTVFATRRQRDEAIERFGAVEGGQQTLAHLAGHVDGLVGR
jgi:uncharacterized protein YndB with AHSA1/START domain